MAKKMQTYVMVWIFIWLFLTVSSLGDQVTTTAGAIKKEGKEKKVRGLVDTVGYAHTAEQMDAVIQMCDSLYSRGSRKHLAADDVKRQSPWVAGICPHDDYLYAAPVYVDIMRNIRSKHVILFGVAHGARNYDLADRLIFDSFDMWQGPYGPVQVSRLREDILKMLPEDVYRVHDEMQSVEHSVEGLIPFLQYYNREVQIVSILVPYMDWERLDRLSRILAEVLRTVILENNLTLGRDIAFLCSNDCVHYGDQGWGGKNYAPFGADMKGYEQAVKRDRNLIDEYFVGPLKTEKLYELFVQLVDQEDVTQYKITWCGRFCVPLGLNTLCYVMRDGRQPPLSGHVLSYDTSVASGELPVRDIGLGSTAPSNLRHWVGYCAIGYR